MNDDEMNENVKEWTKRNENNYDNKECIRNVIKKSRLRKWQKINEIISRGSKK